MRHVLILAALAQASSELPTHDRNAVYQAIVAEVQEADGVGEPLPPPAFPDGAAAEEQRARLVEIAGSKRGADEMLQSSTSAPHKLRLRDRKVEGAVVRSGDLYFVLRGVDLDALDLTSALKAARSEAFEVANMRFQVQLLTADDAKGASRPPAEGREWLTHSRGRILDRLVVESTDRLAASRSADSLILASRRDPDFGAEGPFPNRWATLTLKAGGEVLGEPQAYAGGVGYLKLTRLKGQEKAAVVEAHFAYVEPTAWFNGEPVLRSKLGLMAQDQVRRLRRELLKSP